MKDAGRHSSTRSADGKTTDSLDSKNLKRPCGKILESPLGFGIYPKYTDPICCIKNSNPGAEHRNSSAPKIIYLAPEKFPAPAAPRFERLSIGRGRSIQYQFYDNGQTECALHRSNFGARTKRQPSTSSFITAHGRHHPPTIASEELYSFTVCISQPPAKAPSHTGDRSYHHTQIENQR